MIPLHETVTFTSGGSSHSVDYRAEVIPLTAAESYELGRNVNSVTYRVILGPNVHHISSSATLDWRGNGYQAIGPAMCHTIQGRIHHWELFIAKIGG